MENPNYTREQVKDQIIFKLVNDEYKMVSLDQYKYFFNHNLHLNLPENDVVDYMKEVAFDLPNNVELDQYYQLRLKLSLNKFIEEGGFSGRSRRTQAEEKFQKDKKELELKALKSTIDKNTFDKYVAYCSLLISLLALGVAIFNG